MSGLSESKFYMWRTLFALAHADEVVTAEELRFMAEALEDIPFSQEQKDILTRDIGEPQDIAEMFRKIEDLQDQAAFFEFARKIVWVDGDYGAEEQEILLKLQQEQLKNVDFDKLVGGNTGLEFEKDEGGIPVSETPHSWKDTVRSFRRWFVDDDSEM